MKLCRRPRSVAAGVVGAAALALALLGGADGQAEFGRDFGFGASHVVSPAPPTVDRATVDEMRVKAEGGNKDAAYFMGLLYYYGEGVDKDMERASFYFRQAALAGHVESASNLGLMLYAGMGVSSDDRAALSWFKAAAEKGQADAMWMLGRMYYDGRGGDHGPDYKEALKWFAKSAGAHNFRGQYYMGVMHEYGLGTELDYAKAIEWYSRAAEQNDAQALYNLGLMQAYGRGIDQNFQKAYLLFERAASQDYGPACYYMGVMFTHGHGVPVDYSAALVWFERAVESGDLAIVTKARAAVDDLAPKVEEAKARADAVLAQFDTESEQYDGAGAQKEQSVELPAELLRGLKAGDILTLKHQKGEAP